MPIVDFNKPPPLEAFLDVEQWTTDVEHLMSAVGDGKPTKTEEIAMRWLDAARNAAIANGKSDWTIVKMLKAAGLDMNPRPGEQKDEMVERMKEQGATPYQAFVNAVEKQKQREAALEQMVQALQRENAELQQRLSAPK